MAILKKNAFSRRVPDLVTEELVAVLSRRSSFEFKQLFDIVHENLRARNAASGGEEMLRLRAYEKLQNLVSRSNSLTLPSICARLILVVRVKPKPSQQNEATTLP